MLRATRVLGIDCGSTATGFGVIDSDGRVSALVAHGVIRTKSKEPFELRLRHINCELRAVIETHSPQAVAVEGIFHSVNARSALQLGHVRGVALLAAAEALIPVHEYSPLQIKSSVVGYGRAEKSQVQQMVKMLLRLAEIPAEDAADALAVALCHSHHTLTMARVSRAVSLEKPRPVNITA